MARKVYGDIEIQTGGTLRTQTGSPVYEPTNDNDVATKKYVDDEIGGAPYVSIIAPPFMGNLSPTPKAALGPLGIGDAAFPPGSFAFVIDDAGPSPFVLAYVAVVAGSPSGPTWIRSDTLAPIS